MPTQIKFGTSGWRSIIAEDFTVANVRRAVTGIAKYVVSQKPYGARVIVGRDPRYMGERFVEIAAEILSSYGVQPLVIGEPAPTPAISYEVIRLKADGAINFTASHNPPEYSGIKFSTPDGAPALPEVTKAIEDLIPAEPLPSSAPANRPAIENVDPRPAYLARLKEIINLPLIV
jgi:phosphoglucomutase